MADRTVVRQGPVVTLTLGAVLALAALGPGPDDSNAPRPAPPKDKDAAATTPGKAPAAAAVPFEKQPYKIRAWLSVDPRARVDGRGRETLIAGWKVMVKRFVGAPWELEIAEGDGPLATQALDDVTSEMVIPQAKGFDKAWLFRVEPSADGYSVVGREFDAATAKVGLVCRRPMQVLADGPRALLQLSLDVFAASGEIGKQLDAKHYEVRVQGAMIPAATPLGRIVSVGSVLRPSVVYYKPEGGVLRLDVIKSTYLLVESLEGGVATCRVESALANAITKKIVGKFKYVGVGLKPASIPTRLRFTFFNPDAAPGAPDQNDERPAAGYNVLARPAPDGTPREVGTTDREGRLVLEPGFADGLVILTLLAAGKEPLLEFPVMPGEMVEERLLNHIDPRGPTVSIESGLFALRDEIVDLIAVRHRLEARIKARIEAENWDDAKRLAAEFRTLTPREAMEKQLEKFDETLKAEAQKNPRRRIRTRTALGLLTDTRGLIDRYLDDESIESFEDAIKRYTELSAQNATKVKALPKMPTLPAVGAKGGSGPFTPPGGGFSIALPGSPVEGTAKTADGASDVKTYRLADPTKGTFIVSVWDYPVAVAAGDVDRVLNAERDRLLGTVPGAKIVKDEATSVAGSPGKEVVLEGLAGKGGEGTMLIARIALVNSRVFSVAAFGTKAQVQGQPASDVLSSFRITTKAAPASGANTAATPPPAATPGAGAGAAASGKATEKKTPKAPNPADRSNKPGTVF